MFKLSQKCQGIIRVIKKRKTRQVHSKSLIENVQSLIKTNKKKMDAFLSFKPAETLVQNGSVPIKNTVSPGINSKRGRKSTLG